MSRGRRVAHGAVHRVVDSGGAVVVAGDGDHHQAVSALTQRFVRQPSDGREVGEEVAGPSDQLGDQVLCLGVPEVDRQRALALVESVPVEAGAVGGERPAPVVDAAADAVEADDIGPQLGQRHATRRCGDEGGALDDRQALERKRHAL